MILPHELDGKDGHAIEGWACKTLSRSICRSEWLALWRCRCPSPSLEQTSAEHSSAWPWPHTFCCLTPQLLDGYHGCGKILENSDFLVDNKAVCCGAVGAVSGVSRSVPTACKSKGLIRPDWKAFEVAAGATGAEHSSASPWPHARVTAVNVAGNRPERHDANHWFVDWLQPVIGEERTRALRSCCVHFKSC